MTSVASFPACGSSASNDIHLEPILNDSVANLVQKTLDARKPAELVILELMKRFDFDLEALRSELEGKWPL